MRTKVMGIDLAGTEKNVTGWCVLRVEVDGNGGAEVKLSSVYGDEEIIESVEEENPAVIGIDAPLSFYGKPFRDCDIETRKYYRILPLTFQGMRKLTERGIKLKMIIEKRCKKRVIEVYPYATKRILGIKDEKMLKKFVKCVYMRIKNKHEYDAILCAITAKFFYESNYYAFGKVDRIVVPVPAVEV